MKISRPQSLFINSHTTGTMYLGSIGSGKSYALVLKTILCALDNIRCIVVSFSNANLKDNLVPVYKEVFEMLNIKYKLTISPNIDIKVGTSEILLRTGHEPDRLRGLSVGAFFIDEAREFRDRNIFDILLGRLRQGQYLKWFLSTTTRGKSWFYNIIKEEGLLSVFNTGYANNDYLTVIRTTIDDSPFLPKEYIDTLKRSYSSSFARQELYAEIIEDEGEVIKPSWFIIKPLKAPNTGIRFWDLAVTTNQSSDYSCGCLMNTIKQKYYIYDLIRKKLSYPDLKKLIIQTAMNDGTGVHIGIEVAGQQRAILDDLRREPLLAMHTIKPFKPTKDKITRAYPFASQAELGNVILNDQPWVRDFKDECSTFNAENLGRVKDDQIDSATGAYNMLSKRQIINFASIPALA